MKLRETLASLMLATCVSLGANAFAAEDANLYFVHGIPGRDVAANAEPTFPVDVPINDEVCYLHGFTFGGTNGPLTVPPGEYDTNSPSVDSTVALGGNSGGLTASWPMASASSPAMRNRLPSR